MNDNIVTDTNQPEILSDVNTNGKERPWRDKKIKNDLLVGSYERLGYERKADRASRCGSKLVFKVLPDGSKRLESADFCQIRLCPVCSWRREMKIFSQLSKVVAHVEGDGYRYVFLTLTCKNVDGLDLSKAIDDLFVSFKRFFKIKPIEKVVMGYFRALEITHDTERRITKKMYRERKNYYDGLNLKAGDWNPNFNKYHPHFHVMIAVNTSYFKKYYISQAQWTEYWMQSLQVDYVPMVDIRTVKNQRNKGVKEVAKYTVKDADYIVQEDKPLTDETVTVLDAALNNRRLVAYGGIMRDAHKALNLSDDDSAEVHIDGETEEIEPVSHILEIFEWHVGFKNYVLERREKVTVERIEYTFE